MSASVFPAPVAPDTEEPHDSGAPPWRRRLRVILALVGLDVVPLLTRAGLLVIVLLVLFGVDTVLLGDDDVGSALAGGSGVALHMGVLARFLQNASPGGERLLASLPVRRSEVVAARYVEGLGCVAVTALLGLTIIWAGMMIGKHSGSGTWAGLLCVIIALLTDLVVGLPLVVRFRTSRAWRCAGLVSLAIGAGVAAPIVIMVRRGTRIPVPGLYSGPGLFLMAGGIALGLGALVLALSYRMSARFYARQDL